MSSYLLGIDAGNTMTKASLFDLAGNERGSERRRSVVDFPGPGQNERDASAFWGHACDAVRVLLERTSTEPSEISAVSVSGYGAGLYLVDAEGEPVRPGIMSTDSRALGVIERWGLANLLGPIGARVQQRMWPGQAPPLLGWIDENEPGTVERTHAILSCKDFLRLRLCGDVSTDLTDAGIAGVLDVRRGDYAKDVLSELGIAHWGGKLVPIGRSEEIVGTVSAATARQTGLLEGTPVARGLADVMGSALATGVARPDQLSVVAGTFSINSTLHDEPRVSRLPFLQAAYPTGGHYMATEGSATSASSLEWFCKSILRAEVEQAAAEGRTIYNVCNELVGEAQERENDILFFPFVFGGPNGAPAGLEGLSAAHDLGDIMYAIYECIAFSHKYDIEPLLTGPDAAHPTTIRLTGGASRSDVWAQIFADVLELPIEVCECGESGALGTAMCAAAALDESRALEDVVESMTRVARRFTPREARVARLRRKYDRYCESVSRMAVAPRAEAA